MIINQVIRSLNDLTVNSLKHDEATDTNFVSTPQEGSDIEFITYINYINYAKDGVPRINPNGYNTIAHYSPKKTPNVLELKKMLVILY